MSRTAPAKADAVDRLGQKLVVFSNHDVPYSRSLGGALYKWEGLRR